MVAGIEVLSIVGRCVQTDSGNGFSRWVPPLSAGLWPIKSPLCMPRWNDLYCGAADLIDAGKCR
jgi:hypothetical protein